MDQPDAGEQATAQEKPDRNDFLVVGLGASAGGIKALREFFSLVPPHSNIAYVVILHMSPDRDSRLAQVLQTSTDMPVTQVSEALRMEPNHVYVIAPNKSLHIKDGILAVAEMSALESRRSPVDLFFGTLAVSHKSGSVCVVLSGTGHNGSNGLKRVKEHGGLSIAQDPNQAEYDDMPRNAIATGLVDCILPISQIPGKILAYRNQRDRGELTESPDALSDADATAVREILTLLRLRTGHDFSNYKSATVSRRIDRRMAICEISDRPSYARLVRANPDETRALLRELLISVTNFFRDEGPFTALERMVIPRLFEKPNRAHVRVWVCGCATGEEAYSVAMLLAEGSATANLDIAFQLFATDLDQHAVSRAREGIYSEADVADLNEERLRRFFQKEAGAFRVRRDLRERVLFAHHNAIKDPPFSHLDLICCRNMLIYLNRTAQERVLQTFHFALQPGGYLFLGTSESPDPASDLFMTLDKNAHLYESRVVADHFVARPIVDYSFERLPEVAAPAAAVRYTERMSPGDLHHQLLEEYAPPSVIVTEDFQLLHVSQHAGRFLQVGPGELSRDFLRLLRPELRVQARTALYQALRSRASAEVRHLRLPAADGGEEIIDLTVRPVLKAGDPVRGFLLVFFSPVTERSATVDTHATTDEEPMLRQLEDELTRVRGELRSIVEQYETQVEEAKASNEELQAMNEELRSAAEELETSREELQSVNEELTTVNQELKIKVEELELSNSHLRNLILSTQIGTIFLDRALRVRLSTPLAREVFNLLESDIGRPLSDITNHLVDVNLLDDARQVIERLQPVEREVRTREGRWYLMRLLPYRTSDDRIDGVVITFLETTERRLVEEEVRKNEERFRLLIDGASDYAIFTMSHDGRIDFWNTGAERMFGYAREEMLGQSAALLFPLDAGKTTLDHELGRAARDNVAKTERQYVRKNGSLFYGSVVTTPLQPSSGTISGFATIARDLTPKQEAAEELRSERQGFEENIARRTRDLEAEIGERSAAEERATMLLRKLVTAQEDERARIARDLHDQLGQRMTSLRLALEQHKEHCESSGSVRETLERVQTIAQQIDEEVDFLAWELRPPALDDLGLAVALPKYVEEWSSQYGIEAETRTAGLSQARLPPQLDIAFYRIAQEALNNVAKHAHANRVDVVIEQRGDGLVMVVEDNGVGFDQTDAGHRDGMGLVSMRERAIVIGATLQIESIPARGTTVLLRCMVPQQQEEDAAT